MPLVVALLASALLHVAAVVAPGWTLPEALESDPSPTIDAVLVKAPERAESAPPARSVPRPLARKPVRPLPAPGVAAEETPHELAAVATPTPPAEEPAVAVPATPPAEEPAVVVAEVPQPANIALSGKGYIRYIVTRGEGGFIIGESVHSWEHDGFTYRLKSLTETTGLASVFRPARIIQSSTGEITLAGLRPREFRHERTVGLDSASFDWERRVITYAGREAGLVEGTQDLLSMYYQLVLLAPRSGAIELPIATGRKLANYRFEVLGEELLVLPAGQQQTVHIWTRSGKDRIDMWLPIGAGEQARGLPLKIRIIDRKGDIYDQIANDLPSTETK